MEGDTRESAKSEVKGRRKGLLYSHLPLQPHPAGAAECEGLLFKVCERDPFQTIITMKKETRALRDPD